MTYRVCVRCSIFSSVLSLKHKALQSPQPVCTPPTIPCNTTIAAAIIIAWPDPMRAQIHAQRHTKTHQDTCTPTHTEVMIPSFTNRFKHASTLPKKAEGVRHTHKHTNRAIYTKKDTNTYTSLSLLQGNLHPGERRRTEGKKRREKWRKEGERMRLQRGRERAPTIWPSVLCWCSISAHSSFDGYFFSLSTFYENRL